MLDIVSQLPEGAREWCFKVRIFWRKGDTTFARRERWFVSHKSARNWVGEWCDKVGADYSVGVWVDEPPIGHIDSLNTDSSPRGSYVTRTWTFNHKDADNEDVPRPDDWIDANISVMPLF